MHELSCKVHTRFAGDICSDYDFLEMVKKRAFFGEKLAASSVYPPKDSETQFGLLRDVIKSRPLTGRVPRKG